MVIIKDWKKYYTMEETSKILDEKIEKKAKIFAKKVIEWQKKNNINNEELVYV